MVTTLKPRVQPASTRIRTLQQADRRVTGTTLQNRRQRKYQENPRCARCGRPGLLDELVLDHTVALVNGGADTETNTQLLCAHPCHDEKTAEDMAIARGRGGVETFGRPGL
jgi:5-methylcytosine-specific restriction protein A